MLSNIYREEERQIKEREGEGKILEGKRERVESREKQRIIRIIAAVYNSYIL